MTLTIAAFDNSYARLPEAFRAMQDPVRVTGAELVMLNRPLADELGLNLAGLDEISLAALFSGQQIPLGAEPLAMAYAGHQFGNFVPQLGDGRAILLGEVIDRQGLRRDIQLKGSGRTPFSRRGDGRAALGPVLREYLVAEAMHALGVPTTRALAAVRTGESVLREAGPLPGGVLTRVAASHIRVGTFEYFAARDDHAALRQLTDYVIARHYPDAAGQPRPALALLDAVIRRQAMLVAQWMLVGFIHGVMNTDNMAISGETIDYGPCAFLEAYDPDQVFSAIDSQGRYAYGNQSRVAHWNLAQLARALLPLIDTDQAVAVNLAQDTLDAFPQLFAMHWLDGMRAKLGLDEGAMEADDTALIDDWLALLHRQRADFTLAFHTLGEVAADSAAHSQAAAVFADPASFEPWAARWRDRCARDGRPGNERAHAMRRVNPAIIPRNHRVEQALQAAVEHHDDQPFAALLDVLSRPYAPEPRDLDWTRPAAAGERVTRTFCGT
jgi:uncharacterized protein YdiU (UPF0061 family)